MYEDIALLGRDASRVLKNWGFNSTNTFADYSLADNYFIKNAPNGELLLGEGFTAVDEDLLDTVVTTFGLHLGHVLVSAYSAAWHIPEKEYFSDWDILKSVCICAQEEKVNLYRTVMRRAQAGALPAQRLAELPERFGILTPDAGDTRGATDQENNYFLQTTSALTTTLGNLSFPLTGEIADLPLLDLAAERIFNEDGMVRDERTLTTIVGLDPTAFKISMGIYLGYLMQKCGGGRWKMSGNLLDSSLITESYETLYPVRLGLQVLEGYENSFVQFAPLCAELVVQKLSSQGLIQSEIEARDVYLSLLANVGIQGDEMPSLERGLQVQ